MTNVKELETYCSFLLSDIEIALPMEVVQEIVRYPESITRIPLTPSYCEGIFNLRGSLIPVVHVADLLGVDRNPDVSSLKVAIIKFHDVKMGLVFDDTKEILKVDLENRDEVVYQETSSCPVVKGILKISEGQRLIQLIEAESLIQLEDIPHVMAKVRATGVMDEQKKKRLLKKGITFHVGETSMFFHMKDIHEIVQSNKFERSYINYPYSKGLINIRGMMIPVLDFNLFLGKSTAVNESTGRIILLNFANHQKVGILVESVDTIVTYDDEQVQEVPSMAQLIEGLYSGHLVQESEQYLIINQEFFLQHEEIRHVIEGHAKLALSTVEDKTKTKSKKETYISFRMSGEYCFPILDIQEIINFPEDVTHLPGSKGKLLGIFNLRGKSVSLVNMLDIESENQKVIILKNNEEYVGLVVESVERIFSIYEQDKFPCPSLFKNEEEKSLGQAIRELVTITGADEHKSKRLAVFDKEKFFYPELYAS